ncbi:Holliday junction ATP-dependent DNA helicase RuvA [Deltaproteobacteria bacterium]|nr:Holliday junction ATP-dependent DNA helicase RuvA [Deltaproteobacteria bacterium]
MIARLRGEVVERGPGWLVVDVGGVGYEVLVPVRVAEATRESVTLSVYTAVREDAITLYGFATTDEKAAFESLIGVSGIGPKLGLACLSGLTVDALARAINGGDVRTLSAVPGIGKKTAERLILELKGKLSGGVLAAGTVATPATRADDSLPLALAQLGYKRAEIDLALANLSELGKSAAPLAERIQLSLQRLSRG